MGIRGFLRRCMALWGLGAGVAGCAKEVPATTFLRPIDWVAPKDAPPFDPNRVLDLAALVDYRGLGVGAIDDFLRKTPYGTPSFLETYQSNGTRASDAILRVAAAYNINPLVFLVRAQIDQGLIGEPTYPQPASRVEYAFNCGCPGRGQCDPELAGFDRQVDCLGRELRKSLSEIAENGVTAGGWGPQVASRTLDGISVVPFDEGTAVLYQYAPVVGTGRTGAWLFRNVFQIYAAQLRYVSPSPEDVSTSSPMGGPCRTKGDCQVSGSVCQLGFPNGLCTRYCGGTARCPALATQPTSACVSLDETALCLVVCDPANPRACRDGYQCVSRPVNAAPGTPPGPGTFVCIPNP